MAGLTAEGLDIKRLDDVIDDRIDSAKRHFGNAAKVSVNDVLGRLLRVSAASEADIWELLELEYNSLHPDYAQDTSLDRIVSYGRLTRYEAAPSTANVLVRGDYGTILEEGSYITSSSTSNRFQLSTDVVLGRTSIVGMIIEVLRVSETGEDYGITVDGESYISTQSGATNEEVATALTGAFGNLFNGSASVSPVEDNPEQFEVMFDDIFVSRNITIDTPNALSIRKVYKMAPAHSEEEGPIAQPEGTLDTIGSPQTGWDSVTNPLEASIGNDRETDEELRLRFKRTKEVSARGTIPAIRANLYSLIGVTDAEVYQNDRTVTDQNGLPPHSFSAVVLGGDTVKIAETIWNTKPASIPTYGNTTVDIKDSEGYDQTISFSRPVSVPIYINIEVSATGDTALPDSIGRQIASELMDYFNNNYSVGDDVVYSRLYTPINRTFGGFQVDLLEIGKDPAALGMGNVAISYDEIATLSRDDVTVTITF